MVKLGSMVTDSITGFSGIATSRCQFRFGCVRICIQPIQLKDGLPKENVWIDELRLKEKDAIPTPPPSEWLGKRVTDSVSGFKGIVGSFTKFLNQDERVGIDATVLEKGKPLETLSIDLVQLKEFKGTKKPSAGPADSCPRQIIPPRF